MFELKHFHWIHICNGIIILLPGYGIYLNSSSDLTYLNGCMIQENGADGVKFVHHDELADVQFDRTSIDDFCLVPITTRQTFPISIKVEQNKYDPAGRECFKVCLLLSFPFPC
jgi:hypothetical protein